MVRAHRAACVSHAGRLQRAWVPGGHRLAFNNRHAGVVEALADAGRAVTHRLAEVCPAPHVREQLLHRLGIAPFQLSGVHKNGNGGARLYSVHSDLIA